MKHSVVGSICQIALSHTPVLSFRHLCLRSMCMEFRSPRFGTFCLSLRSLFQTVKFSTGFLSGVQFRFQLEFFPLGFLKLLQKMTHFDFDLYDFQHVSNHWSFLVKLLMMNFLCESLAFASSNDPRFLLGRASVKLTKLLNWACSLMRSSRRIMAWKASMIFQVESPFSFSVK